MKTLRFLPLFLLLAGPALALPRLGIGDEEGETSEAVEIQRRLDFFYKRRALSDGTFAPQARERALHALSTMGISPLQMRRRISPLGVSVAIPYPWEEIGPKPATEPGNPGGYGFVLASGRVNSIAVHPTDPDTVYIGGAFAGVAKSTDGGASWNYLTGAMPSQAISSVAIDPVSTSTVYAGTGDPYYSGNGVSLLGVGVYRSTDSGATWGLISGANNLGGGVVRKIVVDPATSGSWTGTRVYAAVTGGTAPGFYLSSNSGSTWMRTHIDDCFDAVVDQTAPAKVYILCSDQTDGVLGSIDSGASWPNQVMGNPSGGKGRLAMNGSTLFMVFSAPGTNPPNPTFGTDPGQEGVLYRTADPGSIPPSHLTAADGFCDAQCTYDIYVGVDPSNINRIFLGGVDAARSTDGGATFTNYAPFNPPNMTLHSDHHAIAFAPSNPSVIYEGNDGGMYRSVDGGVNWSNLNAHLSGNQIIGISVSGDGHVIVGLQDNGGLMYRNDGTTSWDMVGGGDGGFNKIDPSNSNKYYTTYVTAGPIVDWLLTRTTDDNATYTDITPAAALDVETSEFYPAFFMSPSNSANLLFGGQHVYRSVNSGTSWVRVGNGNSPQAFDVISALQEAPSNPSIIYAAVDGTYGTGVSGVYVTANATLGTSATWAPAPGVQSSILPTNQVPTAIAVHPTLSSTAYVTYSQYGTVGSPKHHIYKTVNRGVTWTTTDAGVPDAPINDILIDPSVPTHVFAASDVGVFASQDSGLTWARSDVGIPEGTIANALAIHPGTRELVVGTYGMGAYRLTLDPAPPPAPASFVATPLGVSSATWSWGLVSAATGYLFYPSTGGAAIELTGTSVTLTELSSNTAYGARVSAGNSGGEGSLTGTVTTYTLAAAPEGSDFTSVGVTSVTVQWSDGGNPAGTVYEVGKWRVGVATSVQTTTAGSAVVTGLTSFSTYYFRVRAKNGNGVFTAPDAFITTRTIHLPPTVAPTAFVASSPDTGTVTFTWRPVAGATGYEFYPATGSVLQTATTSISLTGISTNTAAGGKVAATAFGGHGPLTATVTGYALSAGPVDTSTTSVWISSAAISWDANTNPAGTKYKIEWFKWITPAAILSKLSTVPYATLTGLTPNTSYYARVRALNAKLVATAPDAAVTVLTLPLKPTAAPAVKAFPIATTPVGSLVLGTVTWSWAAVPGAQFYNFYPLAGGATQAPTVVVTTFTTLDTLQNNTPYGARVQAGNVTGLGTLSAIVTGYTLADTPTGTAPAVAITSVTLSWNAASNASAVTYRVEFKKSSASIWTVAAASASAPGVHPLESKTITGLAAATSYDFRVRAYNAKLVPGLPDVVVTTTTLPVKPTAAPASITTQPSLTTPIAGLAIGSITWSWAAVPHATSYYFYPADNGVLGAPVVVTSTFAARTGLALNTAYGARVQAASDGGAGPLSAIVTGYSLADEAVNFSTWGVPSISSAEINIAWDPGGNPTGPVNGTNYQVQYWAVTGATVTLVRVKSTVAQATHLAPSTTYYFRVRSFNQKSFLGTPVDFFAVTLPVAPVARPSWVWDVPSVQPARAAVSAAPPAQAATSAELARVVAFPNPLLAGRPGVTFINVPDGASLKITSSAGVLMRAFTVKGGSAMWNVTDAGGHRVPNGAYNAVLESGGAARTIVLDVRR